MFRLIRKPSSGNTQAFVITKRDIARLYVNICANFLIILACYLMMAA